MRSSAALATRHSPLATHLVLVGARNILKQARDRVVHFGRPASPRARIDDGSQHLRIQAQPWTIKPEAVLNVCESFANICLILCTRSARIILAIPMSKVERLRDPDHADSQEHVVAYFRRLASAYVPAVDHLRTHRLQNLLDVIEIRLGTTDHEGQGAGACRNYACNRNEIGISRLLSLSPLSIGMRPVTFQELPPDTGPSTNLAPTFLASTSSCCATPGSTVLLSTRRAFFFTDLNSKRSIFKLGFRRH